MKIKRNITTNKFFMYLKKSFIVKHINYYTIWYIIKFVFNTFCKFKNKRSETK